MNETLTPILADLTRGTDLSADAVDAAVGEIFEGRVSDVQAAAFIVALRTKGETEGELAALVRAMHRYATHVDVPDGAIDTCGTGGDRSGTVNVSTMAALIAAGAGARVVKHGNRAASSQAGSADVLEELGVAIELGPAGVAKCVEEAGVGFCFARRYHPGMRFLGPARAEIGVPTTFNFLGPLANPARVRRQAVGVCDATMAERMLGALRELGTERAMIFYGDDGLDELTTTTTSSIWRVHDGAVERMSFDPTQFGIPRAELAHLLGGDAGENAEVARSVLAGAPGPVRDAVLLNAAGAMVAHAGLAGNVEWRPAWESALQRAATAIDSGAAEQLLARWVRFTQKV